MSMSKRKAAATEHRQHADDDNDFGGGDGDASDGNNRASSKIEHGGRSFSGPVAVVVGLAVGTVICFRALSTLNSLRVVTCFPVLLCAYSGGSAAAVAFLANVVGKKNKTPTTSISAVEGRILPITLVLTVICGQLPAFLGSAIAATAVVLFGLATLPRGARLQRPKPSTSPVAILMGTLLLITVMLTENFMIWVVSATFPAGQSLDTAPPPLQDNGQLVLTRLLKGLTKRQVVGLRRLWNVQWSLVACLGASFLLFDVYYHPKRQLFSISLRAVLTLALARFIRTVSFLLTVVPSQHQNCYSEHFPFPPPHPYTWEWIAVGFEPASHGGCNDLIISGHATVTSTLACVVASASNDRLFQASLWLLVAMDYAVEIYEGFHYSVDMWLGCVLVCLIFRVLGPVEGHQQDQGRRRDSDSITSPSSPSSSPMASQSNTFGDVSARDVAVYSVPAFIAYVQANLLPRSWANPVIVLYVISIAITFGGFSLRQKTYKLQQAYQHYAQHTTICLLYLALAVYL